MSSADSSEDEAPKRLLKSAYDVQRMKLEKLMKNPAKPVVIPDFNKEKKSQYVPDFVRNVMGSSAGAGSGEFHVYRHLRRKEYARQKSMAEETEKERLDREFREKLERNQQEAEERTAKKRAKRRRKKQKLKEKQKQKKPKKENDEDEDVPTSTDDSESEDENKDAEKKS